MSLDRLRGLDLDLLVVLAALLETRHVSRAAERLGVTQSAVSRSLGRLRELFDDELLVRTGHGMRATARAEALRAPLGRWLANTEELVRPAEAFDPKVHPRRFRLSTADYGTEVVLRPFLQRIDREGLAVELELVPLTPEDLRALGRGEVDVVLGPRDDAGPGIVWSELFRDGFSCLVWQDAGIRRLTLQRFTELRHVLATPRGRPGSIVDDALAARGASRQVVLRTPSFLSIPRLLVGTQLVATLPTRLAQAFAEHHPLRLLTPPLDLPEFAMCLGWHEVHRSDPAHRWLRQHLWPSP